MLFNSIDFAIFLPIVFAAYWLVGKKQITIQNLILLVASYVFYGWWDWRFLSLIFISSLADYLIGIQLKTESREPRRKLFLGMSLVLNLGMLGFFKYFNFFVENFVEAFSFFGMSISPTSLHIILPVGISFYTFQTLSYTIDVYRRKLEPTSDVVAFFAYVSFFPQLVAGPIERATNLIPQFTRERNFDYHRAVDGGRQILWGLFKKMVIADNCAMIVNQIFDNYEDHTGSTLLLGGILFAFQIYGDFSGYSDIAIGTSRLFGFDLMKNFAFPYFSRDIAEFWRRWHISLSTWFRDYLYIPLGGSRGGTWMKVRNTFIIFIVSGFWHGANWTFVVWGFLNALYFLPLLLGNRNRRYTGDIAEGRILPGLREGIQILSTFLLTVLAWVFFRAESIGDAIQYLNGIASFSLFSVPGLLTIKLAGLLAVFITVEWIHRTGEYGLQLSEKIPKVLNWAIYYAIILMILEFGGEPQEFIYFQF